MKKFMFLAATAILALGACSQNEIVNKDLDNGVSVLELTATHEGFVPTHKAIAPTRTTLESGDAVNWAVGDRIKLIWNGGDVTSSALASGGTSATFSFASNPGEGNVYSVYPSGTAASYDGSVFQVTVPSTQDGSFASASIEVSELTGGTELSFKNLASLLEIDVTQSATRSIVIGAYGSKTIAGTAEVTFSAGIPVIGTVTGGSSTVTLNVSGEGTYYAAVLPAALTEGFYVEIHDAADGGGNIISKKLGRNSITLTRRKLLDLGTVAAPELLAQWSFQASSSSLFSNWLSGNNDEKANPISVAGDSGNYVLSTDENSRFRFIQADKSALSVDWSNLYLFSTYQPGFNKIWVGDVVELDIDNSTSISSGTTVNMAFSLRIPNGQLRYWMLEYESGGIWYPVDDPDNPIHEVTLDDSVTYYYNIDRTGNNDSLQTFYFPLKHNIPAHGLKLRFRVTAPTADGLTALTTPQTNTCRFRGVVSKQDRSPVIYVIR